MRGIRPPKKRIERKGEEDEVGCLKGERSIWF
jgi:hypothetical protein